MKKPSRVESGLTVFGVAPCRKPKYFFSPSPSSSPLLWKICQAVYAQIQIEAILTKVKTTNTCFASHLSGQRMRYYGICLTAVLRLFRSAAFPFFFFLSVFLAQFPDQRFHCFRASRSEDWRILYSSGTSCDGF